MTHCNAPPPILMMSPMPNAQVCDIVCRMRGFQEERGAERMANPSHSHIAGLSGFLVELYGRRTEQEPGTSGHKLPLHAALRRGASFGQSTVNRWSRWQDSVALTADSAAIAQRS